MVVLLNVLHILYHIVLALVGGILGSKIVLKGIGKEKNNEKRTNRKN